MAWEDTYLLSPILLVLLASGCCAEDTKLLQTVEGQTFYVKCQYYHSQQVNVKVWYQQTSTKCCKVLVSSLRTEPRRRKFSIRDNPDSRFFTVTKTALTVKDSGLYFCGILKNDRTVAVLRRFRLVVSRGRQSATASAMIPIRTRTKTPPFNTTISRVSKSNMVVLIVCGLFSKTLIFTVLFTVTWRSFGGQTMTTQQ
ncbi:trem-like transcript 4 protein [Microtus pennsylvanicus]|uniref:trem-like transcript 4 protein n=1 Tax=Microtus pennsylvanicus TaxID=10058 RepID=UPI003F6CC9F1